MTTPLGEERNIVTSIAGTTRDSIHTRYNKFGMDFYLVDTAGMRKKGKAMEDLEFYSVMRSIRAIENSDVCILMLDAQQGLESQDLNIHNLIVRNRKGCVIVVNKWDLVEKDNNTMKEWTEFLKKKLAPFNDIPIIFTSVLSKQRIFDVLQTAIRVYESRKRRISTSALNDFLLPLIENYPPPATKGQIHQDQICNPVADADAAVRVLRQPAAVHQGTLPPLPRKQHPRPLGFLRGADANLLPAEIRTGCGIVRVCRRRNPALTFPLNPPLTKGNFYKPGYQCKSTSGRNKDSCGIARSCRRKNPALIFPLSPPLTRGLFLYRGADADLLPAEIRKENICPAIRTKQKGTRRVVPLQLRYASRRRANSLRAVSESSTTTPARIAGSANCSRAGKLASATSISNSPKAPSSISHPS